MVSEDWAERDSLSPMERSFQINRVQTERRMEFTSSRAFQDANNKMLVVLIKRHGKKLAGRFLWLLKKEHLPKGNKLELQEICAQSKVKQNRNKRKCCCD